MTGDTDFTLSCPVPLSQYPNVLLAHGGGGRLMHDLISRMMVATFANPVLEAGHDSAVLPSPGGRLAFTTDSYVVRPLFFPGGDIGALAVHGTVNDLAMSGARPVGLSVGFIIEEGLPMTDLWRVVRSMKAAADESGVAIVTGDTKVVDRGKGDGIFVNTAGVGTVVAPDPISPASVRAGDAVIVSGDIGRHGMAIMCAREGLEMESEIESDAASLLAPVMDLLESGVRVHCLRDCTRGGLATTLNEISASCGLGIRMEESRILVRGDVQAACEVLGFDPLYVACEGRFVAFVAPDDADRAVEVMRRHAVSSGAAVIGRAEPSERPLVTMKTLIGSTRIVDMLSGEQLPRIC
jgi:hydrogenase expression/formation protein HypE